MNKTNEEIQKEIEVIISKSNSYEEALKNICEAYPEIDYELLKKNFEEEKKKAEKSFMEKTDSEAIQNLSEHELEEVAGGSFGSWMKKNWPIVLGAASIITVGAICWTKGYLSKASSSKLSKQHKDGFSEGVVETTEHYSE